MNLIVVCNYFSAVVHCPMVWDTIMCWPETQAGTHVEQQCPNYIHFFYKRSKFLKTIAWINAVPKTTVGMLKNCLKSTLYIRLFLQNYWSKHLMNIKIRIVFFQFDSACFSEYAYKICLDDGTWYDPLGGNETDGWTNYTLCVVTKSPQTTTQKTPDVVSLVMVCVCLTVSEKERDAHVGVL